MRNAAVKAGAKFIVSPGFDPEIVNYCLEKEIPIFPGCVTPSEVAQAVKRGLKVVKFFPAEPAVGVAMIKAMWRKLDSKSRSDQKRRIRENL